MDTSMESLHVDGVKCGALVRRRTPREVRTLVVRRDAQGLRRHDSSLTHPGDPRAWTTYTYRCDDGAAIELARTPNGQVSVDGRAHDVPADTIPAHSATALLEDMLAASATEAEFHRLDEQAPEQPPAPAHYSVGNPEPHPLGTGGREDLGVVELFVDDEPVEKFWFDSHEIVASERAGTRSLREQTVEDLVEGLDDEAAAAVRAFCG